MTLTWQQYDSVTTGGKPHFYRAFDAQHDCLAAIVWHRGKRAYAVEYCSDRQPVEISPECWGMNLITVLPYTKQGASPGGLTP